MGLWAERCMLANHQFIDGGRLWSLRVRLSLRAHFQICKAHSKSSFVPANMHFSTFSKSQSTHKGRLRMEWFSHVDKINLSNLGIFEFDFWKLKIDGRQCHLQPLMLINDANAILCHCHPKWKLKITYDQPIKVHHPFSSQPIISLKLGNFLAFKKLPGKFIRSRP